MTGNAKLPSYQVTKLQDKTMKALEGIKVLDFTHVQSGPTCTLYIPSVYAYGANGIGSDIPSNASLEFEILLFQTN